MTSLGMRDADVSTVELVRAPDKLARSVNRVRPYRDEAARMNPLRQFRKLRAVPQESWQVPPHPHSAGEERPALAVVRGAVAGARPATPRDEAAVRRRFAACPTHDGHSLTRIRRWQAWTTRHPSATRSCTTCSGRRPTTTRSTHQFEVSLYFDVSDAAELQEGGDV